MSSLRIMLAELIKVSATPKEVLRLGFLCFGILGFLQAIGRTDLVGVEPVIGLWQSFGLSLVCLVLLEVYGRLQRKGYLEEQEDLARKVVNE